MPPLVSTVDVQSAENKILSAHWFPRVTNGDIFFPSERGVLSLFSLLFAFFFLGSYVSFGSL